MLVFVGRILQRT